MEEQIHTWRVLSEYEPSIEVKGKLVGTLFSAFRGTHLLFTSDWARLLNYNVDKRGSRGVRTNMKVVRQKGRCGGRTPSGDPRG